MHLILSFKVDDRLSSGFWFYWDTTIQNRQLLNSSTSLLFNKHEKTPQVLLIYNAINDYPVVYTKLSTSQVLSDRYMGWLQLLHVSIIVQLSSLTLLAQSNPVPSSASTLSSSSSELHLTA